MRNSDSDQLDTIWQLLRKRFFQHFHSGERSNKALEYDHELLSSPDIISHHNRLFSKKKSLRVEIFLNYLGPSLKHQRSPTSSPKSIHPNAQKTVDALFQNNSPRTNLFRVGDTNFQKSVLVIQENERLVRNQINFLFSFWDVLRTVLNGTLRVDYASRTLRWIDLDSVDETDLVFATPGGTHFQTCSSCPVLSNEQFSLLYESEEGKTLHRPSSLEK